MCMPPPNGAPWYYSGGIDRLAWEAARYLPQREAYWQHAAPAVGTHDGTIINGLLDKGAESYSRLVHVGSCPEVGRE